MISKLKSGAAAGRKAVPDCHLGMKSQQKSRPHYNCTTVIYTLSRFNLTTSLDRSWNRTFLHSNQLVKRVTQSAGADHLGPLVAQTPRPGLSSNQHCMCR